MAITDTLLRVRRALLNLCDKLAPLAPALLRLAVGVVFVRTGWGKLSDLDKVTAFFTDLHIPMPALNAAVSACTEFFGGILIIAGLGTRLAALPMAFTMVIAIITAKRDEIEGIASIIAFDEFAYFAIFIALAITGAGALSLDALIARKLGARSKLPAPAPLAVAPRAATHT